MANHQDVSLLIMVGISGSGKTTYAKTLEDAYIASSDKVRADLFNGVYNASENAKVFDEYNRRIIGAVKSGEYKTVVADATNLDMSSVDDLLLMAKTLSCKAYIVSIETPIAECEKRNASRTGNARVPDDVIEKQKRKKESVLSQIKSNKYLESLLFYVFQEDGKYVLKKKSKLDPAEIEADKILYNERAEAQIEKTKNCKQLIAKCEKVKPLIMLQSEDLSQIF